jgi:hypothetical protein
VILLAHACPNCGSRAGQSCERRYHGQTDRSPCTIRVVMTDRREGCVADQLGMGNDELVALLLAAKKNRALMNTYRRLV